MMRLCGSWCWICCFVGRCSMGHVSRGAVRGCVKGPNSGHASAVYPSSTCWQAGAEEHLRMPSVPNQTPWSHFHLELPPQNTPPTCQVGAGRSGPVAKPCLSEQPTVLSLHYYEALKCFLIINCTIVKLKKKVWLIWENFLMRGDEVCCNFNWSSLTRSIFLVYSMWYGLMLYTQLSAIY